MMFNFILGRIIKRPFKFFDIAARKFTTTALTAAVTTTTTTTS